MKKTKLLLTLLAIGIFAFLAFTVGAADDKFNATYGSGEKAFRLATGSPGELGLLKVLAEEFNQINGALC